MYNTCNSCWTRRTCGCCTLLEEIAQLLFGGTNNGCGGNTTNTGCCGTTWNNGCGCVRNTCCCQRNTQGIPVYGRVYLQTTNGVGVTTGGQTTNGFVGQGCGCAFANANGFNTNGYTTCGYTPYTRNTCGY